MALWERGKFRATSMLETFLAGWPVTTVNALDYEVSPGAGSAAIHHGSLSAFESDLQGLRNSAPPEPVRHAVWSLWSCFKCDNRHREHRDGGGAASGCKACQVQGDSREETEHTHVWGGGVKVMSRSLHSAKKIGIFKYIQGLQYGTCHQV